MNQIKQLNSNQNFSIIRSPFIYSKSKESLGSTSHNLIITLSDFFNIFYTSYFIQIQSYYNKHNLTCLTKNLT